MKFYIANGETRKKLLDLYHQDEAKSKARNALVKKYKAMGHVSNGNIMVGMVFKGEPLKPWRSVKSSVAGHAAPDRTKEGKAIRAEMDATACHSWLDVARIVGVVSWHPGEFSIPNFRVWGSTVVFGVDDRDTPNPDCKRISDMRYEAMLEQEKAKRKKKRLTRCKKANAG